MSTTTPNLLTEIRGRPSDFVPEAFRLAGVPVQERPATACASCPSAIWHFQGEWRCFCNVMKFAAWQGKGSPIAVCDGREAALVRFEEHQRNLAGR